MTRDFEHMGKGEIEPVNHWRECIHRNLAEDGYLVSASKDGCTIGEIIEVGIGEMFRVMGEATFFDAVRQAKRSAAISGDEVVEPPAGWRFYKALPVAGGRA